MGNIVLFPKLTPGVRRSMEHRLLEGTEPALVAAQYGVSTRWLRQQFEQRLPFRAAWGQ